MKKKKKKMRKVIFPPSPQFLRSVLPIVCLCTKECTQTIVFWAYNTKIRIINLRPLKTQLWCTSILYSAEQIVSQTKNTNVVVRKLDLSSLKSVRQFAEEINKTETRLDILIHNAGMANTFRKMATEDGLEITMATNQYGPFLLTHLLIGNPTIRVNL